eukprot:765448-Hanusia_phi.AAC.3
MLTFEKCGINIVRSTSTDQTSTPPPQEVLSTDSRLLAPQPALPSMTSAQVGNAVAQPYPGSQDIYEENPEPVADFDENPVGTHMPDK